MKQNKNFTSATKKEPALQSCPFLVADVKFFCLDRKVDEMTEPSTNIKISSEKKDRCAVCKKKLGLCSIECRCRLKFCATHRYPEAHQCTFDFKTSERARLAGLVAGGGAFQKLEKV